MSIVTFTNSNVNETGQTLSSAIVAMACAIEHNYRILLISTDFNNSTMENCFINNFRGRKSNFFNSLFTNRGGGDIASGIEGLVRMFASNRASGEAVKSFAKPILTEGRLDIIASPKTRDIRDYNNMTAYFSQIAEVASREYDFVFIDLYGKMNKESKEKILGISNVIVVGLLQNLSSIYGFADLKESNSFYKKNNVLLCIDKYNPNSKHTNKNIARLLGEKNVPYIVPYNILFSDYCSEGDILNYALLARSVTDKEGKDRYLYDSVLKLIDGIDFKRKEVEYGA